MSDLISVIIPTYQHADVLSDCLDAVLAQSYQNIEVIVVDDGSTDHTSQVLEPYQTHKRVRVIQQTNHGSNPARMRGFAESTGSYVIFCDADVVMQPNMLEMLYQTLQSHPQASYAYSGFRFGWKTFKPVAFNPERLKQHNYIHTTSLIRRKDFPGFDPAIKRLQDWDVWLTMLEEGRTGIAVLKELFSVRIEGASRVGSAWMPSWVYRLPWKWIGWMPERLKKYEEARQTLARKHNV